MNLNHFFFLQTQFYVIKFYKINIFKSHAQKISPQGNRLLPRSRGQNRITEMKNKNYCHINDWQFETSNC